MTFIIIVTLALLLLLLPQGLNGFPTGFASETLLSGLDTPIDIAFLPDGRSLVVQIMGDVSIVDFRTAGFATSKYLSITDVELVGERGLMDIALAPDFSTAKTKYIYTYYAKKSITAFVIARFTHIENLGGLSSYADLSTEFTVFTDQKFPGIYHYGGQISFGPDGAIYLTQGDKTKDTDAQLMDRYNGKVIRVMPNGTFPGDNLGARTPGALPGIWMLGLRNGYRSRWDLQTNRFFIFEVGGNQNQVSTEDIHFGEAGKNLGWPDCEGSCSNPNFSKCSCTLYDDPLYTYPHAGSGAAIIGGLVYRGSQFPSEYQGALFFADFPSKTIKYLKFDSTGKKVASDNTFAESTGLKIITLEPGPDGAIYYTTLPGDVGRIVYTQKVNTAPVITSASISATTGTAPLTVTFSGGAVDVNGDTLQYTWFVGEGNSQILSTQGSYTFTTAGTYQAYFQVSDGVATVTSTVTAIKVTAPQTSVVSVVSPIEGATFKAGDSVLIDCATAGSSTALTTSITVNRFDNGGTQQMLFTSFAAAQGTFIVPTSGLNFDSASGYTIICTLKNRNQVISTAQANIYPKLTSLSVDTVPSGVEVTIDGVAHVTPYSMSSLSQFTQTLSVPASTSCIGGLLYAFSQWSDGGALSHAVSFKNDKALVASFVSTGPCTTAVTITTQVQTVDPNLVFHVDATTGVNTSVGSLVTSWADLSGNGNHLVAAAPLLSPLLVAAGLNGKNFIKFNGVDSGLRTITYQKLPSGVPKLSIIMVVKYDGPGWGGFTYGQATCGAVIGMGVTATLGNLFVESFCDGNTIASGVLGMGAGWMIETLVFSNQASKHYKDSTLIQQVSSYTYNIPSTGSICLGTEQSLGGKVNMSVAEIMMFSVALTDAERLSYETSLRAKYSIGGSSSSSSSVTTTTTTTSSSTTKASTTTSSQATSSSSSTPTTTATTKPATIASTSTSKASTTVTSASAATSSTSLSSTSTASPTTSLNLVTDLNSVTLSPVIPKGMITAKITKGLKTQLEANQLVKIGNGNRILTWYDLVGDVHLVAGDTLPLLVSGGLNGNNYIQFDGVADRLVNGLSPISTLPKGSGSRQVFMVVRYNSAGAGGFAWGDYAASCGSVFGLGATNTSTFYFEDSCDSLKKFDTGINTHLSGWVVQTASFNSKTLVLLEMIGTGIVKSGKAQYISTVSDSIVLGADLLRKHHVSMDVAEILIYNRKLKTKEHKKVVQALQKKYQI